MLREAHVPLTHSVHSVLALGLSTSQQLGRHRAGGERQYTGGAWMRQTPRETGKGRTQMCL